MKANYKEKINSQKVTLGNLYEINKQLMEKEPPLSNAELQMAKEHLREWVTNNFKQKYLMLLCHELRDYTLFNLDKTGSWVVAKPEAVYDSVNDIIDCMLNRGTLLVADAQEDNSWELWIRNEEGCFAYYLFPYGAAVLEY